MSSRLDSSKMNRVRENKEERNPKQQANSFRTAQKSDRKRTEMLNCNTETDGQDIEAKHEETLGRECQVNYLHPQE